MDFVDSLNISGILVAAVAAFIVGFLWHGPLFGKQWMRLMEISDAKAKEMQARGMGPMIPHMIITFVQQAVIAAVLGYLASLTGAATITEMMVLAAWVWLGFVVTTLLTTVLWEGRKVSLFSFNIIYHLVSMLVIAAVLGWIE